MFIKYLILTLAILFIYPAQANTSPITITSGVPYEQAKASLVADGWKPVKNSKISSSSLYAQEIFEKGLTEVLDCISMDLDACTFLYIRNNKRIIVRTITRDLKVDKVYLMNKK
jgi:hypothetical protein